jgi:hypothetical protein
VASEAGTISYKRYFAPFALLGRFIRPGEVKIDAEREKAIAVKTISD